VAIPVATPGATFAPISANTSTTLLTNTLSFPGEFCEDIQRNPAFVETFALAAAQDYSNLVGYRVNCIRVYCGSLMADFAAVVNRNDTATVTRLTQNMQSVNNQPTTNWLPTTKGVMAALGLPLLVPPIASVPVLGGSVGFSNATQIPYVLANSAGLSKMTVLAVLVMGICALI